MAVHKAGAVLATKKWVLRRSSSLIEGKIITLKKPLTYVGVEVDKNLSFGPHVEKLH